MTPPRPPRLLLFGGDEPVMGKLRAQLEAGHDIDSVAGTDEALQALRDQPYDAVIAGIGDFLPLERQLVSDESSLVLRTIGEGVCVVDADGRMRWSNDRLRSFRPEVVERVKRIGGQALQIFRAGSGGMTQAMQEQSGPRSKKFTFQIDQRYFEMICSPVVRGEDLPSQIVAVVWDATSGRRLQSKIDAIDASGRELAKLDAEELCKLAPADRLKLLQEKIIKFSKDLMHFDHFNIRLLDKRTNKLEVVIAEGLPPEALEIDLYGQPEGNGISGYVAATGRSYICHDTEKDPRYVLGLQHCKSSLTVPLNLFDEVVGVYNIESETVGSFNEDDRQFAEIFGRYVALALNILDLLVVERYTTSGQITDNVLGEMDAPLSDIVSEAQSLMEEYIGDDHMRGKLSRIVDQVQGIRNSIAEVKAGPNTVLGNQGDNPGQVDPLVAGKTILVADDESSIRTAIRNILSKRGCHVDMCKDGYEACTMLEQQAYDLVISDIRMPYRNGYEIFASAQRYHEGTPVLLMTGFGYDPHHSIVRASQEGLSSVIFKPFKVEQLMDEVHKALAPRHPGPAPDQAPAHG